MNHLMPTLRAAGILVVSLASAASMIVTLAGPAEAPTPGPAERVEQMLEDGATPVEGIVVGDDPMHMDCASTPELILCSDGFSL